MLLFVLQGDNNDCDDGADVVVVAEGNSGVPIDRGYAFVIVAGTFFIYLSVNCSLAFV